MTASLLFPQLAQIKLEKLRAELVKGENSGKSMPLDLDALEQEALAELEAGDLEVDPKLRSTLRPGLLPHSL